MNMSADYILELHQRAELYIKQLPLSELIKNYEGAKKLLNRPNLPTVTVDEITPAIAETMVRTIGGAVNLYNPTKLKNYVAYLKSAAEKAANHEDQKLISSEIPSENPIYEELYTQASKEVEYWKTEYNTLLHSIMVERQNTSHSNFVRGEIEQGDL